MDCEICAKHQGEGALVVPVVWDDGELVVTHAPASDDEPVYAGHLFVETRRHVRYLDDLTADEAAAVGRLVSCLAGALRAELDLAFVFTMVAGRGVAHYHQHVFVPHRGTPPGYHPAQVDEWPDAPSLTPSEVDDLCHRLHRRIVAATGHI